MTAAPTRVVIEADGGSRGNPGKAAYGAVLKDAGSGRVIAERAERIGVASNNVAEYRGLIAGLELYRTYADGAELEVRMDSKLVVEQMAGRWKIKHPAMRPLALEANRLVPPDTRWTWVPRAQNAHADRLANIALDGPEGVVHGGPADADSDANSTADAGASADSHESASAAAGTAVTTVVLVQTGTTAQLERTGAWLAAGLEGDVVLLSAEDPALGEGAQLLGRHLGTTPSTGTSVDATASPARVRAVLTATHPGEVVVLVAGRQLVSGLAASVLGLASRTSLRAAPAPGSVTVLDLDADGGVVRVLGAMPVLGLRPPADD